MPRIAAYPASQKEAWSLAVCDGSVNFRGSSGIEWREIVSIRRCPILPEDSPSPHWISITGFPSLL